MRALALLLVLWGGADEMRTQLDAIRAGKRRSELKRLLPKWRKQAEADGALAGTYNDAVTLARGMKLKADYLTTRIESRRFGATKKTLPHFVLDTIRGERWVWEAPKKHDVLVRRRAGVLARKGAHTIRLHIWIYPLDRGEIANPGANPKQAAAVWLDYLKKGLKDPRVTQKPAKKKFNKHYGSCFTIEISGLDRQGVWVRHRCWFVKPRHGSLAMVQVESREKEPDVELEAILASIRNP